MSVLNALHLGGKYSKISVENGSKKTNQSKTKVKKKKKKILFKRICCNLRSETMLIENKIFVILKINQ
ncbi:Androgenic gland hormone [Frankliniella fusca]|uniref:Androgenic gland hormone n=1 Tax=Frankliniella fusca TaxID=407009 RepID=A0AAE1HHN6_9NEOP|nr:Androgenic gland hormone [Frankliniella fusca]